MLKQRQWGTLLLALQVLVTAIPHKVQASVNADDNDKTNTAVSRTDATDEAPEPVAGITYGTPKSLAEGGSGANSSLRFSLNIAQTYDDSTFLSDTNSRSDFFTSITPSFLFDRTSSRTQLQFTYRPRFAAYNRSSDLNFVSHDLVVDYGYQFSKRWRLSLGESFNFVPETSGLFFSNRSNRALDPLTGTQAFASLPRRRVIRNTNYFQAQYQWSLRSYVALGTTYQIQRDGGNTFTQFDGLSGRISYNYRYGPRGTIGTTYQYQRIRYQGGFGQSESHALLLGNAFRLGRRMDISLSAGPSYSVFDGQQQVNLSPLLTLLLGTPSLQLPAVQRQIGLATSGRLVYNFSNAAVGIAYSRGVNNSGGLRGSVRSESVNVFLQRKLFRRGSFMLSGNYVNGTFGRRAVQATGGLSRFAGQVQLSRSLTETTSLFIRYQHTRQSALGSVLGRTRNMVTVGFGFNPKRAIWEK